MSTRDLELVQLVLLLGTCDIDDVILNMVGVFLGWLFWKVMTRN